MTSSRWSKVAVVGVVAVGVSVGTIALPAASKTTHIKFAGRYTKSAHPAGYAVLERAMKDYEKQHPGVKVDYVGASGHAEFLEKMLVMAAAGTFPDVIHLYQPWVFDFAARGLTEPFSADVANRLKPSFYPITLNSLTTKGRLYALPTENQVQALVYNKKILREAGIGTLPQTWAELEFLATKLTVVGANGKTQRWGLSAELSDWATPGMFRMLLAANGGAFMNKEGLAFNSTVGVKAVEDMRRWFIGTKFASADISLVNQDKVAFCIGYPWHLISHEPKLKSKLQDALGVTDMPAGTAGRSAYHYSWGYSVARSSKVKRDAMDFVQFLVSQVSPADGMTYIGAAMGELGSLPSYKPDAQKGRFVQLAGWFGGFARNLDWAAPTDGLALQGKMDQVLYEELQPVITSVKGSPATAVDNARRRIEVVLKKGK